MTIARRTAGFIVLLCGVVLGSLASCSAGEPTSTMQRFQGTWESVNAEPGEAITITVEGDTLYFYKNDEFWWDTTFTLPTDREPPHLHATIPRPTKHSGDEIIAFYKFEHGILTLAGVRSPESNEPAWPTSVDTAESGMAGRYELRRVRPDGERP